MLQGLQYQLIEEEDQIVMLQSCTFIADTRLNETGFAMLVVYNTLTRKKEPFKPIHDGEVRMYVCGVTVYDSCHLGHARSIVAFDVIRRYHESKGFNVRYIQNFTDIDDKMIQRAQEQGVTFDKLATKYIREYFEDIDPLGVKRATAYPKATEHIKDMITIIEKLVKKGYAYEANGSVYFRVSKFKNYGKLSRRSIKDIKEAAEKAEPGEKEKVEDFVLWKRMKPGEPYWKSPWGKGRPGWHIECSVMGPKYLGDQLDIHGGGLDLVFPHHENEIAQAESLTGKPFVKYWLHNGFLTVNKEKMSKSLGNFFTIKEITEKYEPEIIRLFLVSSQYRSPIDFNDSQLEEAKSRLGRIHNAIDLLTRHLKSAREEENISPATPSPADQKLWKALSKLRQEFEKAMDDDFNTPVALASLNKFLSQMNTILSSAASATAGTLQEIFDTLDAYGEILGLYRQRMAAAITGSESQAIIEKLIQLLIELRAEARKQKNFDAADKIRTKLKKMGIILEDEATGTTWKWA